MLLFHEEYFCEAPVTHASICGTGNAFSEDGKSITLTNGETILKNNCLTIADTAELIGFDMWNFVENASRGTLSLAG